MKRVLSILLFIPFALIALAEWTVEKNDKYQFYFDGDLTTDTRSDGSSLTYIDCDYSCEFIKLQLCVRISNDIKIDSIQTQIWMPEVAKVDNVDFSPYIGTLCDQNTTESPIDLFDIEVESNWNQRVNFDGFDYWHNTIIVLSHSLLAKQSLNENDKYLPSGNYPICDLLVDVSSLMAGWNNILIQCGEPELSGLFDNTSKRMYIPENDYRIKIYRDPEWHSISEITGEKEGRPHSTGIYTLDGRRVSRALPGDAYIIDGKVTIPSHDIVR